MQRIACVGAIVHDDHGRLLIIQRGKPPAEGTWSIPGGRVEPHETAAQACAREVLEETGLQVHVGELIGCVERPAPDGSLFVIDDFRATLVNPDTQVTAGDDARAVAWATLADLQVLPTAPGLIDALTEWNCLPL